jgi:broad specificity phosphatase PhoE
VKTIYFVRHGETAANVAKIVTGSSDDTSLTVKGRQQAHHAGRDLKPKKVELIICSPLARTVETAEIIAKEIGYNSHSILINPLFIERDCGTYEGGPEKPYDKAIATGTLHASVETTAHMYDRLMRALDSLKQYKENTILVVSHGGASRAVQAIVQNVHHSKMYELRKINNAEIYEFTL